jgi:hypothetical protein
LIQFRILIQLKIHFSLPYANISLFGMKTEVAPISFPCSFCLTSLIPEFSKTWFQENILSFIMLYLRELKQACITPWSGGVAEWLTLQTSNLRIAAWVQTLLGASRCYLQQENLHSLLSIGWFQERIRKCFNKLIASNTIKIR